MLLELWRIIRHRCLVCGEPAALRHWLWIPGGGDLKLFSPWCRAHAHGKGGRGAVARAADPRRRS